MEDFSFNKRSEAFLRMPEVEFIADSRTFERGELIKKRARYEYASQYEVGI